MKHKIFLVLGLPLVLAGCSKNKLCQVDYSNFSVPQVDLDHLDIKYTDSLPVDTTTGLRIEGEYKILDIYELSDTHGMISYAQGETFGLDGLATVINQKRTENPGGTILFSNGDMWQGSAESNLTRGKLVTQTMRYIGFDCMVLGNHEFDWGDEIIKKNHDLFSKQPQNPGDFYMPFLAGNLRMKADETVVPSEIVDQYKVITRGDVKIGIIGTLGNVEDSIIKSSFDKYKIIGAQTYACQTAQYLKDDLGCDVVIWSSHQDATTMQFETGMYANYIDAYFGGHKHVQTGKRDDTLKKCRVASDNEAADIAHVQIKLDKTTNAFVDSSFDFIEASKTTVQADTKVSNVIAQYKVETDKAANVAIGEVTGKFDNASSLSNLSCKATMEAAIQNDPNEEKPIIASFVNGTKGVRASIEEGVVKYGDVYQAFPFDNEVVTFECKGNMVANYFAGSGMKWCQNFGSTENLQPTKTYRIVTSDFVATSPNYFNIPESKITHTNLVIRDVVAKYFATHCGINPNDYLGAEYQSPLD